MWVYKLTSADSANPSAPALLLDTDPTAVALVSFARSHQIREVYLSISTAALQHPNLPSFVAGLKNGCLRVEALVDSDYTDSLDSMIAAIKSFNAAAPSASGRFDGIHLDIEPWIGTGSDYSWVAPLVERYKLARGLLDGTSMTLAADMSIIKLANADTRMVTNRQALLDAATRLVLFAYELPEQRIYDYTDSFLQWADTSQAKFSLATRVADFGASDRFNAACQNGNILTRINARYQNTPGYYGWATFSYNHYWRAYDSAYPDASVRGQPICTTVACCAIPGS